MESGVIYHIINCIGSKYSRASSTPIGNFQLSTALLVDATKLCFHMCFLFYTGILKDICPFPTGTCMTMFQMLSKIICLKEFLDIIAFSKFVHIYEVLKSTVPIWLRKIRKFLSTISAGIMRRTSIGLCSGQRRQMETAW